MKALLLDTLNNSKQNDFKHGMTWYKEARQWCQLQSEVYNVPLYKVVGVLAALSPRNKWNRNKEDTINVIKHGFNAKCATFHNNKQKACDILKATSIEHVIKLLNGMKVQSFFSNIYHDDCNLVTVDVWAMRVVGFEGNLTPKKYREIENVYRDMANELGMLPKQLQAITWSTYRGSHI